MGHAETSLTIRHRLFSVTTLLVRPLFLACAALLAAVGGCAARPATPEWPPFVTQLIARLEAEPTSNPPGSIWRYNYKGRVVFYVPPSCCDVASELYDGDGSLICGPDGGLSGDGDGKCPDFFELRTDELRVWSDSRR